MFDLNQIDKMNHVINNLKIILANKCLIMKTQSECDGFSIDYLKLDCSGFPKPYQHWSGHADFVLTSGVCANASLWTIDDITINEHPYTDLMALIGREFLVKNATEETWAELDGYDDPTNQDEYTNPVYYDANYRYKKWMQENRWEYVEHCLAELEYIVETNSVKPSYKLTIAQIKESLK